MGVAFNTGVALLDALVLSVTSQEDTYGYKITQEVRGVMSISESTLYPVLRRLQKDGCLEAYDQAYAGRNRRYYRITAQGRQTLEQYRQEWREYEARIHSVLFKGVES